MAAPQRSNSVPTTKKNDGPPPKPCHLVTRTRGNSPSGGCWDKDTRIGELRCPNGRSSHVGEVYVGRFWTRKPFTPCATSPLVRMLWGWVRLSEWLTGCPIRLKGSNVQTDKLWQTFLAHWVTAQRTPRSYVLQRLTTNTTLTRLYNVS